MPNKNPPNPFFPFETTSKVQMLSPPSTITCTPTSKNQIHHNNKLQESLVIYVDEWYLVLKETMVGHFH
jgi:hypothetical protein